VKSHSSPKKDLSGRIFRVPEGVRQSPESMMKDTDGIEIKPFQGLA